MMDIPGHLPRGEKPLARRPLKTRLADLMAAVLAFVLLAPQGFGLRRK